MITIPRVFLQIEEASLPYSARVGRREKEERGDLVGVHLLTDGMIIIFYMTPIQQFPSRYYTLTFIDCFFKGRFSRTKH